MKGKANGSREGKIQTSNDSSKELIMMEIISGITGEKRVGNNASDEYCLVISSCLPIKLANVTEDNTWIYKILNNNNNNPTGSCRLQLTHKMGASYTGS